MKQWLRKLLGIEDILDALERIHMDNLKLRSDFTVTMGADELDPRRKAASDAIGQEVIRRMVAEDMARKHTTGKL